MRGRVRHNSGELSIEHINIPIKIVLNTLLSRWKTSLSIVLYDFYTTVWLHDKSQKSNHSPVVDLAWDE